MLSMYNLSQILEPRKMVSKVVRILVMYDMIISQPIHTDCQCSGTTRPTVCAFSLYPTYFREFEKPISRSCVARSWDVWTVTARTHTLLGVP